MVQSHIETEFCPLVGDFRGPVFKLLLENEDSPNICSVSLGESNLSFQRQNSSLCGFGESEMISKHLMPVSSRSAALFMLLGFRCYKRN